MRLTPIVLAFSLLAAATALPLLVAEEPPLKPIPAGEGRPDVPSDDKCDVYVYCLQIPWYIDGDDAYWSANKYIDALCCTGVDQEIGIWDSSSENGFQYCTGPNSPCNVVQGPPKPPTFRGLSKRLAAEGPASSYLHATPSKVRTRLKDQSGRPIYFDPRPALREFGDRFPHYVRLQPTDPAAAPIYVRLSFGFADLSKCVFFTEDPARPLAKSPVDFKVPIRVVSIGLESDKPAAVPDSEIPLVTDLQPWPGLEHSPRACVLTHRGRTFHVTTTVDVRSPEKGKPAGTRP